MPQARDHWDRMDQPGTPMPKMARVVVISTDESAGGHRSVGSPPRAFAEAAPVASVVLCAVWARRPDSHPRSRRGAFLRHLTCCYTVGLTGSEPAAPCGGLRLRRPMPISLQSLEKPRVSSSFAGVGEPLTTRNVWWSRSTYADSMRGVSVGRYRLPHRHLARIILYAPRLH